MKILAGLTGAMAPAALFAAETVPPGEDDLLTWLFLGFFALVVVGQLIPAVMLIVGLFKGAAARDKAKTGAP